MVLARRPPPSPYAVSPRARTLCTHSCHTRGIPLCRKTSLLTRGQLACLVGRATGAACSSCKRIACTHRTGDLAPAIDTVHKHALCPRRRPKEATDWSSCWVLGNMRDNCSRIPRSGSLGCGFLSGCASRVCSSWESCTSLEPACNDVSCCSWGGMLCGNPCCRRRNGNLGCQTRAIDDIQNISWASCMTCALACTYACLPLASVLLPLVMC